MIALLAFLMVADIATQLMIEKRGGYERNPLFRKADGTLNLLPNIAVKLAALVGLYLIGIWWITAIACGVQGAVVANNLLVLRKL